MRERFMTPPDMDPLNATAEASWRTAVAALRRGGDVCGNDCWRDRNRWRPRGFFTARPARRFFLAARLCRRPAGITRRTLASHFKRSRTLKLMTLIDAAHLLRVGEAEKPRVALTPRQARRPF